MYARAVVTSMCKYIHAHTFVPLALLALACPGTCFFVSCFFALAGLSALPFADFHFLLGWAMATDSSGATCFPMNPFPVNLPPTSSFSDFSFSPSTFLFFQIIRCLKPSQLPSSTLFKFARAIRRHSYTLPFIRDSALPAGSAFFLCHREVAPSS